MTEPTWLNVETIRAIHDHFLERFGGFPGVRDENALESAAWRARWRHSMGGATLAECAAAYAYAFASNHAFHDGNKRIAFYAMVAFLACNGFQIDELDVARDVMIAVATREMSEEALAAWIAARMRPRKR